LFAAQTPQALGLQLSQRLNEKMLAVARNLSSDIIPAPEEYP
jgi:hypothetical protein